MQATPEGTAPPTIPGTPPGSTRPIQDLITRNRDQKRNRLGWSYFGSVPTIEDIPLEQTALAKAIAAIETERQLLANSLQHLFDDKLRPAVRRAQGVREEEEARLAAQNSRALAVNAEIETKQAQLAEKRDAAVNADRAALRELDEPLRQAHITAAERVALVGGSYDPADPHERCVLRDTPRPLEVVAADLKLPWTPADPKTLMHAAISWIVTILIGVMIGLSLGLVAGLLNPDALMRKPVSLVLCILIGFAVAVMTKYAVKQTYQRASERYYLGRPFLNWVPFALLAAIVTIGLVWIDALVEREGLLKLVRLQAGMMSLSTGHHSGNADKEFIYLLIATILSSPYILYAGWEGYIIGRRHAVINQLMARQTADFEAADTARRSDPLVQEALQAIAKVNEIRQQQNMLRLRIATTAEPFDRAIAELEANRRPVDQELSEEARKRYQDAIDALHCAQETFDAEFGEAMEELEPSTTGWKQSWRPRRTAQSHIHSGGKQPLRQT